MKKFFLLVCMVSYTLIADTPPDEGYHLVDRRAYVTNLDAYQNTALLGCVQAIMGEYFSYKVQQNEALTTGYKFNAFRFLGIKKSLLQEFGDLNGTNYQAESTELGSKLVDISIAKDSLWIPMASTGIFSVEDKYQVTQDYYYY